MSTSPLILIADDDPERAARVTAAMLSMVKLDLATLRVAANGPEA